jgi:hypothetical protein
VLKSIETYTESCGALFAGLMICGVVVAGIAVAMAMFSQSTYEQERRKWVRSISDNKRYKV